MTTHFDLDRRFRELTSEEVEHPELLAGFSRHSDFGADSWDTLLKSPRVVILAEAGSGKTAELRDRADRLVSQGERAFFVEVEQLARKNLAASLSAKDALHFAQWRASPDAKAYFFLDAVDELKLTKGKLSEAINAFALGVQDALDRVYLVVTCRPNDWRPQTDPEVLRRAVPYDSNVAEGEVPGDLFFQPLVSLSSANQVNNDKPAVATWRTVVLVPLSNDQIRMFSTQLGVARPDLFIAELERRNAWDFARRPLDLKDLVDAWIAHGRLGNRQEQLEANVASRLLEKPDRLDGHILSTTRAREGAERLALAMALTRTRNIRVPEQALDAERAHGILDPAGILPDWTADERAALLRQALFDPATYGRVRFHHRSIQEYLAARRLFTLKQRGMTMAALYRLLFARQYGVDVVLPSMAPMAAWLALWIPEVMKSLLMREPETLLEHGDPESLTTESRIKTLRAFATMYGTGQWRGLNIPIDEVRRLAHPDLDPTLRELWETSSGNSDVRELLLELIWKGASRECVDLALVAALEQSFDPYHRLLGIWALATVGCTTELAVIARHMVSNPGHWPTGLAARATPSLFPAVLSVFDLLTIAQRAPDGKRPNDGIGLPLKEICGDILATDPLAIERRQGLVALILSGRHDEEPYDITGSFDHLVPALATLCARQLRTSGAVDPALIHASAVAGRFGHREAEEEIGTLRSAIAAIPALRESIFWAELALADYLLPESNTLVRLFRVQEATLLTGWLPSDLPWLLKAAGDQTHPERREAALEIVIRIPDAAHIGPSKLDALRRAVVDDEVLSAHLTTALNPGPAKHWAELEATHRQRVAGERFEEEISLLHWDAWRQEVRADPLRAFAPAFIGANADQILFWLRRARSWANRRWQDEEMLAAAFGPDVARLFLTELKRRWRQLAVPTGQSDMLGWSNSQIQAALISVEVEAKEAGWASRLSQSEATIATAVALNMVNGFADWLTELTEW